MNALSFIGKTGLAVLFLIGINSQAGAQFDDLYYDPSSFNNQSSSAHSSSSSSSSSYDSRGYDNDSYGQYDDASYGGYDDYDYQYASRIRRFHRPNPGFGFYDPFYIDPWYYDPFWVGPADIYVGSSFMWNPWNRWNRWNRWGGGWCGFNSFYNPYFGSPSVVIMNNYGWGWDPYFRPYSPYNHWGWGGGYHNPGWNSPGWGWGGWNNDNSPSNVVYRPRQGGAVTSTERASPRGGLRNPDGTRVQPGVHTDPLAPGGRTAPRSGGRNEGVAPDRNSTNPVREPAQREATDPRSPARNAEETRPTRRFFQMGRDQEAPARNNDRQSPQEPRRNNQAEPQPNRRSENWRNDDNSRRQEAPTRRQETPTRRNDSPSYERPSTPSHSPSRSSSGSSGGSRSGGSSGGGGSSSPRRGG